MLLSSSGSSASAGSSVSFTLSGVSLVHTCNPNCADLTSGSLQGWSEGDWVPYDLAINVPGGSYNGPVVISLDYNLTHPVPGAYAIDSFAACGGQFPKGATSAAGQCGNGDIPNTGASTVGKVLVDGSPISPDNIAITGTPFVIQVTLSSHSFSTGTHHIQWANHLAKSGGPNLANTELGFTLEPTPHALGAAFWPGARIHEYSSLDGVPGVRSVPILKPGALPEKSLDISTTVVDSTRGSTDPNNFAAGDSFHDTANLTFNGDEPVGSIVYHFFNGSTCNSTQENFAFNNTVWPNIVPISSDGSVPDSQSTGALGAGDYSFMANYTGTTYGNYTNECEPFTVQVQGFPPPPQSLSLSKDATGFYNTTYSYGISKSVNSTHVNAAGGSSVAFNYTVNVTHDAGTTSGVIVNGTITVSNPNVDDVIATVTDRLSDGTVCLVSNGLSATITPPSSNFVYTCSLPQLPQSPLNNTAIVTWNHQTLTTGNLAAGNANFTVQGISFSKKIVDGCASVSDNLTGALGQICNTDQSPKSFAYIHTAVAPSGSCETINNLANVTAQTSGTTSSASKTVTLCGGADLAVSKSAIPSTNWTISKSVTPSSITAAVGSNATFHYTVKVNNTIDSVTGRINVTNPNNFESITFTLSDSVNNGGVCTITGGPGPYSIPASTTQTYSYKCTYSGNPSSATGINSASATWNATKYSTPHGSSSGTASFSFSPSPVTVTDTLGSSLGACSVVNSTCVFHYDHKFVVTETCATYPNTATIVQTGKTASASVQVCPKHVSGFLTMGFWKNPNGQFVISHDGSTANVCNSVPYLKQFHAFANLNTASNCAAVAYYVSGVINGATCSSSTNTCNTMLRAQMLSTALDVYFSGNSATSCNVGNWTGTSGSYTKNGGYIHAGTYTNGTGVPYCSGESGGDIVKNYNGGITGFLGTTKVDLNAITCAGDGGLCTPGSVTTAFGGKNSMTLLQMLSWQNISDPTLDSGASWYAQFKSFQVFAKDAFDAINNNLALLSV